MNDPILTHSGGERRWLVHHNKKRRCALLAALAYVACSLALAGAAHFFVGGIGSRAEAATDVTSYAAETSTISPSGYASPFNDSAALGGQTLGMWRNSSVSKTLALSKPADELVIRARGSLCNGAPRMQVSVGGTEIINTLVSSTTYTNFSKTGLSLSGSQAIKVSFTNDYYVNSNCDRNLYVDHVSLRSNASSSPPPPTPPPPPPSGGGEVLWADTFNRDADTFVGPWDWMDRAYPDRLTTSNAGPVRAGSHAARFTVYNSDVAPLTVSENPRAQLNYGAGSNGRFCEGQERWIAWSQFFPSNFPDHQPYWWTQQATIGWGHPYGGTRSPVNLAIENGAGGADRFRMNLNGTTRWQETLQRSSWYDFTFHIKFSRNSSVGFIEMWKNGQRVTFSGGQQRIYTNTLPTTNSPYCGNLQLPNYYGASQAGTQTIYYDEVKVGTSYAAVQPGT
jgi:predicted xylan-binding protein with Ca-dependent carbohydrate-binding module/polysaccharide lyase-like protein